MPALNAQRAGIEQRTRAHRNAAHELLTPGEDPQHAALEEERQHAEH